jgi:hypothetical protein
MLPLSQWPTQVVRPRQAMSEKPLLTPFSQPGVYQPRFWPMLGGPMR